MDLHSMGQSESGIIYQSSLLKLGGLFKNKWTFRWGLVKNVESIGKIVEWRESPESDEIKHWIPFDLIHKVLFTELAQQYFMTIHTEWREYKFKICEKEIWNEWKQCFAIFEDNTDNT